MNNKKEQQEQESRRKMRGYWTSLVNKKKELKQQKQVEQINMKKNNIEPHAADVQSLQDFVFDTSPRPENSDYDDTKEVILEHSVPFPTNQISENSEKRKSEIRLPGSSQTEQA